MNVRFAPKQSARKQSGFTLIEVLIAIMITAMIGIGANEVLGQAIEISQRTQEKLESLGALQKTVLVLSRDFRQVAARSVRDGFGDNQAAVSTRNDDYKIQFTRTGWRNPLGDVRSDLQRVAYSVEDGVLKRSHWLALDQAQDSKPIERELLRDVEEIQFRFMNAEGGWVDEWPPESDASQTGNAQQDDLLVYNQLPQAIGVRLKLQEFGEITKTYDLSAYLSNAAIANGNNNGNNGNGGDGSGANNSGGAINPNPNGELPNE